MIGESGQLVVRRSSISRLPVDLSSVGFSSVFSDHMLTAEYRGGEWHGMTIAPYGPLSLPPSISSLQYGVSVFEGLKAQRTTEGRVALFRPRENAKRLNRSAARLAMPPFPEESFLRGLRELVTLDSAWVPPVGKGALYIRPCLFSTDDSVRVKPAEQYAFVIFTFPFGTYYSGAVDLLVAERHTRAFPGGTGDIKAAGNYAAALVADAEAKQAGYSAVLWLDGVHRKYVEECGVMNVFFRIDDAIVTPSLDGTILPGVTRDSAIRVLRDIGLEVVERRIPVDELLQAHERGSLRECFGTGTAATLSQVHRIRYGDRDVVLPPVEQQKVGAELRERLIRIATGQEPDRYGWLEVV